MQILERGGTVMGPPHAEGGVKFVLPSGRIIEEEGREINIPEELTESDQVFTFHGTNKQILNDILALAGLSIHDEVTDVRWRDIVICVRSVEDETKRTVSGTIEEILHKINTSNGCRPIMADGRGQMEDGKQPMIAKEGMKISENSKGGYNYSGEARQIAKKSGLITLPEKINGTNCGNCIFFKNNFCDHKKILLPVTSRMCCAFWDDKSFRSHLENVWDADFFPDKDKTYPLNEDGGYDYSGKALDKVREADLITLPPTIEGTNCAAGNCLYRKNNMCIHPKINLPVTDRMSCAWWDNDQVKRIWGKPVEIEFGGGGRISAKERARDWQSENPNSPRWKKKKNKLEQLSNNIHRLRMNVSKTISDHMNSVNRGEKEFLTALVVAIMDRTAERIGNDDSADNGHFGVTGFQKKHIHIAGNKVHLEYDGKVGMKQEKSFSDERIAKALKNAIKNSQSKFIFETSDGFRIKADKVNRYLAQFKISAKDMRGYLANKWMIDKLKVAGGSGSGSETTRQRKKIFNKALTQTAGEVGHSKGTLKKHYLIPELQNQYVENGNIIDMKNLGYFAEGSKITNIPIEFNNLSVSKLAEKYSKEELDTLIKQLEEGALDLLHKGEFEKNKKLRELIGRVIDAYQLAKSKKQMSIDKPDSVINRLLSENSEEILSLDFDDSEMLWDEESNRRFYIKRISQDKYILEESGSLGKRHPSILVMRSQLMNEGSRITNENSNTMKKIKVNYYFNHPRMGFSNSITVDAKDDEQAIEKAKQAVSETYGSKMLKRFSFSANVNEKKAEGGRIAEETLRQLGGNKFLAMMGGAAFYDGDALVVKIRGSRKAKSINIKLNQKDLYDVTFINWKKSDFSDLTRQTFNDVYADQLNNLIEKETGLITKLEEGAVITDEPETNCGCFSTYIKQENPELCERLMAEEINSTPELREQMDEVYQAWSGGKLNPNPKGNKYK